MDNHYCGRCGGKMEPDKTERAMFCPACRRKVYPRINPAVIIGVINGSIGQKLYDAKIYFQNADLLSWTLIIILLSVAGEKLFVRLLRSLYRRAVRR